MMAMVDIVS